MQTDYPTAPEAISYDTIDLSFTLESNSHIDAPAKIKAMALAQTLANVLGLETLRVQILTGGEHAEASFPLSPGEKAELARGIAVAMAESDPELAEIMTEVADAVAATTES